MAAITPGSQDDHILSSASRAAYPYTLTILEPFPGSQLEERPEWQDVLKELAHGDIETLHWGHELRYPFRLIVLIEWSHGTDEGRKADSSTWHILDTMLSTSPQSYELTLDMTHAAFTRRERMDLTIIKGDPMLVHPDLLSSLDEVQRRIMQRPDYTLTGITAGITAVDTESRTIAVIMSWVDAETHLRQEEDPTELTKSQTSRFDALYATLQELQSHGALVKSFLLSLERYQPSDKTASVRDKRRHLPGERKERRAPGQRKRPLQLRIEP